MEASLWPYTRGAIVKYNAPFTKEVCIRYGIPPSHPMLVVNAVTSQPSRRYQCLLITSKVDQYYGYRIYMNTANMKTRKYGVIACTEMYTIDDKYMGDILGYVPPHLVDKCVEGYGFEIGLSDKLPEYYEGEESVISWLTAGEANHPSHPEVFRVNGAPDDAFKNLQVATAFRPRSVDKFQTTPIVSKTPQIVDYAEGIIPGTIDTPTQIVSEVVGSVFVVDKDAGKASDQLKDDDTKAESAPKDVDVAPEEDKQIPAVKTSKRTKTVKAKEPKAEDGNESTAKRPHYKKIQTMSVDLQNYIESRKYKYVKKSDALIQAFASLSHNDKYEMWMGRMSAHSVIERKLANSYYSARQLIDFTNYNTSTQKQKLIDGCIDHSINLKFLGDAFMTAYRTLTLEEIRQIRMGMATYESYAKSYGIAFTDTYLGELRDAGLL